ncbi:hypothetical protein AVEN_187619-1 [Araneus ventricosus]|uniref:DUF4817 domain-containing protein n=1 Tax=Araneus ventricosus TaxID=182803 RepID=A0A4Y2JZB0_ARAVE|nr:hypothetical protein AVEN_187619-1 [Araneus ventricosus]
MLAETPLTKEERIDVIGTTRHVVRTFNATHRLQITHDTVAKLTMKFKGTGSIAYASRYGTPTTTTDEGASTLVLAAMTKRQTEWTRRLSAQTGNSQSSAMYNLRANMWHPYNLHILQHLAKDDPDRRVEFYGELETPLHFATSCRPTSSYHFIKPSNDLENLGWKRALNNPLSRIQIRKLINFIFKNEDILFPPN